MSWLCNDSFCFSLSLFSLSCSVSPLCYFVCVGVCVSICATVHLCNPSPIISHLVSCCFKAPVSPLLIVRLFHQQQVFYSLGRWVFPVSYILLCCDSSCIWVIIFVLLCSDCLCQPDFTFTPQTSIPSPGTPLWTSAFPTPIVLRLSSHHLFHGTTFCLLTPTLCTHLSFLFPFYSLKKGRTQKINNKISIIIIHHFKNYGCCKAACGGFVFLGLC